MTGRDKEYNIFPVAMHCSRFNCLFLANTYTCKPAETTMKKTTLCLLLSLAAFGTLPLSAQSPRSNIYLFNVDRVNDTTYQFSQPRWLTYYNRDGYNNHPFFMDEDLIYVSSQLPGQAQPDIYALNLRDTTRTRVTATVEGEYSPARMPDYINFSAVRQEYLPRDTVRRLWQFPINRPRTSTDNGKPVFKYVNNIGYYQWINNRLVAVFLTETPAALAIADLQTDQIRRVATEVGRTLRMAPGGKLLFVKKGFIDPWRIMEVDPVRGGEPVPVINTLTGAEDFAVLPDGTLLMALGSKIYKYTRPRDEGWAEVADLSYYGIRSITRMAVSPGGRIAVVSN